MPIKDAILTLLRDPDFAASYIKCGMEDTETSFSADILQEIVKARGTTKISRRTKMKRGTILKMVSPNGNPTLRSLNILLDALGLKITIEPKERIPYRERVRKINRGEL